jgi:ADP-ribose pyrophosphatase YjhB (NUDIX family)
MDYIKELRALVGTRPLIMVGATLLALNHDNQLLMIKRTDNHCWGVPGGAMELGESLEETVQRETQEEIGVAVRDLELFGVYSGKELYYKYRDGNEVYNVSVVYITRNFGGDVRVNPNEHSEHKFFDLENLPAEISPPIQPILRDLVSQEGIKV